MVTTRGDVDSSSSSSSTSSARCTLLNDSTDEWEYLDWSSRRSSIHGNGLFTISDLRTSEIVMMETPLLQIPAPQLDINLDPPRDATIDLLAQASALEDAQKSSLIRIMKAHTVQYVRIDSVARLESLLKESSGCERQLSAVEKQLWAAVYVQGNRLQGASRRETFQLFSNFHRFNHACKPNAEAAWNPELEILVVRAIRSIEEDEEVTISYLHNPLVPRADRWKALRFRCRCETCSATGANFVRLEAQYQKYSAASDTLLSFKNQWLGRHRRLDFDVTKEIARAMYTNWALIEKLIHAAQVISDEWLIEENPRFSCHSMIFQALQMLNISMWIACGDRVNLLSASLCRYKEVGILGDCLGFEHPKTRAAVISAWDMARIDLTGQETTQARAALWRILVKRCWKFDHEKREIDRLGYWNGEE